MRYQTMNDGWAFTPAGTGGWTARTMGEDARPVTLPHDFKLEFPRDPLAPGGASEAFYPGGAGLYRRTITADKAMADGRVFLYIDGAYRLTQIRLNRELIALHQNGYTGFWVDLTGKLSLGDNQLLITVDAGPSPCSRWYTGGGLYRGVTLATGGKTIFSPWGLWANTLSVNETDAVLAVTATAEGLEAPGCEIRYTLFNGEGTPASTALGKPGEQTALPVPGARLWSVEDPYLYTLRAELRCGEQTVDTETLRVGIRTVTVDVQRGLLLNGQPIKLKGGCVHHDNGPLGAKSYPDAEYRKVRLLKENGYNAVRCAHNPPASVFLDACDSLGMLVIDEAFDCWREGKRQYDDHLFFEAGWEEAISAMVLRDRSHPSVILWSTGNEIVERSGVSDGAAWSARLADRVRALDPTRPLINAVCGFFEDPEIAEMAANSLSTAGEGMDYWAQHSAAFLAPLDVAGYNYLLDRYTKDHALFPGRMFIGTESFPMQALENWRAVETLPYLFGDFVWTAWDYLGESGIGHSDFEGKATGLGAYPWHLAWCGDLDICGIKRPQSHYRDFLWTDRMEPYIVTRHPKHNGQEESITPWGWPEAEPSWSYAGQEGKPVPVTVYARADAVELFLNGVSQGKKPVGLAQGYQASFTVPYQPGELKAVASIGGQPVGQAALYTAGAPHSVTIVPETPPETVQAGGLLYLQLAVTDAHGVLVPDADGQLEAQAQGAALLALGSANPVGEESYLGASVRPYQGKALAIVQAGEADAVFTVRYPGLAPAAIRLPWGKR